MQTESLTIAENILADISILCVDQKDNKSINSDLIFKLNELLLQIDPVLRELRHNHRTLEASGFIRYRSDLARVFNGYLKSIDSLLPDHQVTAAELTCGPDGFKINHNYTIADVQQFLHDVSSYIDGVIDREFSISGTNKEPVAAKPVKLKFTCQSNQVYHLFYWLKYSGYIDNTQDEIIRFIMDNVSIKGKNPASYGTIRAELTRNSLPENKKIIPPTE
jgi:hypothetical protein